MTRGDYITEEDKVLSTEEMKEMDAEVKRVAEIFRIVLKFREQFQPSGIEFSNLRQYTNGDDASRIDWKSSARSSDLYVKEFEEEMDLDIFIILDVSDTMLFGTSDRLKTEYAGIMAATLTWAGVDSGLNVGLGMYGEETTFIEPQGDFTQYNIILNEITDPSNYGGQFDLESALDDIIGRVKDDTAIFILSDFLEAKEGWDTKLNIVSSKFKHAAAFMVRDLRDYKLPKTGNIHFKSVDGSDSMIVNTDYIKDNFEEEAANQEEQIKSKVQENGAGFRKIDTRDNFASELANFFQDETQEW